jgi:tetratricopeptide (TPR) repeat protein
MTPVGRNASCPCGSGKRYKECHGAILASGSAESPALAQPASVSQIMREALLAQQDGNLVQAAERYRRVLAADPSNFDATHMLGLIEYESGRYEIALGLVRRAIELQPNLGTPRRNLLLLESMPRVEAEICREVLPRLARRVDLAVDATSLATAARVNVVIGETLEEEERRALAQIVAACGTAPVSLWDELAGGAQAAEGARALSAAEHPHGGALVLLGAARSLAAWLSQARAERVLVVATRVAPCEIIDRIDELSAAGYDRPGLLCATRALADRLRLPQVSTLPQPAGAACIDA